MEDFERRMEVLRARFVQRAQGDAQILRQAWDVRDDETLRRVSHSLAGNAGLFGQPQLSEAARQLEEALQRPETAGHLHAKVEAILTLIEDGDDSAG